MKRALPEFALAVAAVIASIAGVHTAPVPAAPVPTFAKDVAPIMFEKCTTCHRTGEVAPMTFLSYEDVRPWAKVIRSKVVAREMPPWGADPDHSLKMRNDRSLSKQQIDTIVAWVDGGAPKGSDADLPAVPKFAEGWTYGREPDYVLEMPVEAQIPAEGELGVQMFYTPVPWKEDRFAEVLEIRPGNRAVVHHAGVFVVDLPEGATVVDGRLIAPNGKAATHRADVGKRIPAGKYINWQVHYNPIGKPEKDRTRLGIWFNKVPVTHELLIRQAGDALATTKGGLSLYRAEGKEVEYAADEGTTRRRSKTPNIPPYAEDWSLTGITPVTEDITLYAMSPHMHLRGKSLRWVIVYPDGREQTILDVPRFDFNWQIQYELAEPLHIPAGSKILGIGKYDNSPRNKWNPAPNLPVYWSEQSWDEMYQPFTEYSVDSQVLSDMTITKSPGAGI
jgi:hypothetical protein